MFYGGVIASCITGGYRNGIVEQICGSIEREGLVLTLGKME